MRYLSLGEILRIHEAVVAASGGSTGIRDLGILEAAVAQPHSTFDGQELYPDLVSKAAALCFSIVAGHPFIDGNKRVAHAAMDIFLSLNGLEIRADVDELEKVMLGLATGSMPREDFLEWMTKHSAPLEGS